MNYRVYVKKKEAFRVEADSLFHELKQKDPFLSFPQG